MDAVMVVHQLQRLATASPPSASLVAKLPRVAVGICYFIDHPDVGVRQQAANAVKAVALKHYEILRLTCCGDLKDSNQATRGSSTDDRMKSQDTTKSGSGKEGSSSSSTPKESSGKDACSSSRSEDASNDGRRDDSISDSERNNTSSSGEEGSGTKDSGRSSSSFGGPVPPARTEKNLITLLQRHVDSEDSVVRDCCAAALQALLQPAKAAAGRRETPVPAAAPVAAGLAPALASEAAAVAEKNSVVAHGAPTATVQGSPAAVAVASDGSAHTPAADLYTRPLQTSQRERQNQPSETGARPQGSAECLIEPQSSCVFAATCIAEPDVARVSSSSSTVSYTPVEGELCTVLLGLRGLLGQYERLEQQQQPQRQGGCLSAGAEATAEPCINSCQGLEKLRRDLQYRLVRVPGVSSVTITLNTRYLQQQLLLRERRQRALQLRCYSSSSSTNSAANGNSSETRDCSSSFVTSKKCTAAASHQQGENQETEKQTQDREREGDGVAVLLMRLPSPPKKRLRALQAVKDVCGPLTLVLRATRVYEHRKVVASSRRASSKCRAAGAPHGVNPEQQQDARCCNREEGEEVEEEASTNRGGAAGFSVAAAPARPTYLDDEQQSGSRTAAVAAAGDSRYSSRKEDDTSFFESDAAEGTRGHRDCTEGAGFYGWGPTAAGFSFFSRSSAVFCQSRHLSGHLLPYEEDERRVAARLKKEKEMKQQMQRERAARESIVDRVLSNIGKGVFW